MRIPRSAVLLVSLLALAGSLPLDASLGSPVGPAIERVAGEVDLHYSLVIQAPTLAAARSEIDRHAPAMLARLDDARRRLDDSGCPGTGAMVGMLDQGERRLEDYLDEVIPMLVLPAVRDACAGYADDLDQLVTRMKERLDSTWCR